MGRRGSAVTPPPSRDSIRFRAVSRNATRLDPKKAEGMSTESLPLADLPAANLVVLGLIAVVGLLLWATGRRALRVTFAGLGLLIGAALGYLIGNAVHLGVPPWVSAAAGAILTACFGLLLYRFAVAVTLGLALAVAVPLVVWAADDWRRPSPDAPPLDEARATLDAPIEAPSEALPDDAPDAGAAADAAPKTEHPDELAAQVKQRLNALSERLGAAVRLDTAGHERLDRVQAFLDRLIDRAAAVWAKAPQPLRPFLAVAACIGFLMGLLLGSLAPSFSTSFVTAAGGAIIWLAAGSMLIAETPAGDASWLPRSPRAWIAWWGLAAVIGLGIQWTMRPKAADKSE
jgi:hypothetical protein